jgi:hypothetical protein
MAEVGTLEWLEQEHLDRLDDKYDLIFVDYRDGWDSDQVALIASGNLEALWDTTLDWECEARWEGTQYEMGELRDEIERAHPELDLSDLFEDFRDTIHDERVRVEIQDRDEGTWVKQLTSHTTDPLLRYTLLGEDDCWSFEEVSVDHFLVKVGLPDTPKNRDAAAEVIANASPEYSVGMVSVLFVASLDLLMETGEDELLTITDPHLWLGNPFAGSGWEAGFEGELTVRRGDVRTDKDAWGWSWTDVAGSDPSFFDTDVKVRAA